MQKYREEWEKANTWVENVRDNVYKAHCTVCRRAFSVAHGGLNDLKQHAASGGHMRSIRDNKTRGTLDQFVVHQATPEADMVRTIFFFYMGKYQVVWMSALYGQRYYNIIQTRYIYVYMCVYKL